MPGPLTVDRMIKINKEYNLIILSGLAEKLKQSEENI